MKSNFDRGTVREFIEELDLLVDIDAGELFPLQMLELWYDVRKILCLEYDIELEEGSEGSDD